MIFKNMKLKQQFKFTTIDNKFYDFFTFHINNNEFFTITYCYFIIHNIKQQFVKNDYFYNNIILVGLKHFLEYLSLEF